ncbi:PiT family inorganic phosphate transporter [Saccharothrix violaceirubra]|uniref:PiT family inorganic phosphate transporter n=1 Tax=Saccharothrix violaceirubra TaxID=413306 RepID=A0A7W7T6G5_9PSEU|nr:PiT family inorganic phosphate transporter [Saccharothrix violaceirubra]
MTNYRVAILWGTAATLVGCVVSLTLATRMTALFSTGIVSVAPTTEFTIAVLVGTTGWVAVATLLRLPVSTTHALVGSLVGAGTMLAADSVRWSALLPKVVQPLLSSVLAAYAVSAALAALGRVRRRRVDVPGSARADVARGRVVDAIVGRAHWATSGLASFARGLNDTPKIVAIGAAALVPAGFATWHILVVVTVAMAVGSLAGGLRIAKRLAEDVVTMSHREGFTANLTTAALVGVGAWAGLPMSTTQVSTGAIAGSAGTAVRRINGKTVRQFAIAWIVTPPFAGTVAALIFLVLR